MIFNYFKGPSDEMNGLVNDKSICSICGKTGDCFELDYVITAVFNEDEKEGKLGCFSCLKEGRFEFWHDTEYGMLDENGLRKFYNHHMSNPPSIAADRLIELRRTPQIVTWQQELWLTHCDDFMVYTGTWTPQDFYLNSPNGDGKALFMSMTDTKLNRLWDDSLRENETILKHWHPTYYVFECSLCGKLRGNWDCD